MNSLRKQNNIVFLGFSLFIFFIIIYILIEKENNAPKKYPTPPVYTTVTYPDLPGFLPNSIHT